MVRRRNGGKEKKNQRKGDTYRGVLYINASSPKNPSLSYWKTWTKTLKIKYQYQQWTRAACDKNTNQLGIHAILRLKTVKVSSAKGWHSTVKVGVQLLRFLPIPQTFLYNDLLANNVEVVSIITLFNHLVSYIYLHKTNTLLHWLTMM